METTSDIIVAVCLVGWISILALFSGISRVIEAVKGKKEDKK
jgi:hypothetical protein